VWNDRALYNQELKGNHGYKRRIDENHAADRCIECGACEGVCPQKIDIIAKLKQADAEMR
jgi:predicted aldo/keto reductase-like oxidoreductase